MKRNDVRLYSAAFTTMVAAAACYAAGCGLEVLEPVAGAGGGSAGTGGSVGGGGGAGGQGGQVAADRGDPADFPTDCLESCEDACDALEACDGASSSAYPMEKEECLYRCGVAQDGWFWDDVSGNFRCCVAQTGCAQVKHCGGWLHHPDADASCDKICSCFMGGGALSVLIDGRQAPPGYQLATDLVVVASDHGSVDLASIDGVKSVRPGHYAQVKLARSANAGTLAALRQAGRLLPTFTDGSGRISAATGRIVVEASLAVAKQRAAELAARHGMGTMRELRYGKGLHLIDGSDGWQALDALAELRAAGLDAELDMLREHRLRYLPDDPLFPEQWHLRNVGQGVSTASVDGRVSEAWDLTMGDPQVIVGINDSGINLDHPDFAGKLEPPLNYPPNWKSEMQPGGFADHGTSVAGVVAALADDSLGGVGVCPACRILPHPVGEISGQGFQVTDQEVADGFADMVDAGAWVINNSWGLGMGEATYWDGNVEVPDLPAVVDAAFVYAETTGRGGLGTVLVWAAGNDNTQLDYYAEYPTSVTVSAVGDLGLKSFYSSFGPNVTVGAPSNGMLTGITTTYYDGGYTDGFGGTSSAAPFVTGVIGLMMSANPNLTAVEIRTRLAASATQIDRVFGDYQTDHSVYYGGGLVNAYTAVQMATGNCTDPALCPAPSDDCGSQCGTKTICDVCRTHADCATDHVCQALPSLGRLVCVPAKGGSPCPFGTTEHNGYCLPAADTCGLCVGGEECNGRDDNCDGVVDEGACDTGAWCFADGLGCESGLACAAYRCIQSCDQDTDCEEGYSCELLKDQYGNYGQVKGCIASSSGGCSDGCGVLASSVDDETLQAFVDCMKDGEADCSMAMACMQLLPVTF